MRSRSPHPTAARVRRGNSDRGIHNHLADKVDDANSRQAGAFDVSARCGLDTNETTWELFMVRLRRPSESMRVGYQHHPSTSSRSPAARPNPAAPVPRSATRRQCHVNACLPSDSHHTPPASTNARLVVTYRSPTPGCAGRLRPPRSGLRGAAGAGVNPGALGRGSSAIQRRDVPALLGR
jgi:hypothetical protein